MIIKIEKDIKDLKIGIFGTRAHYFAEVLDERKINYSILEYDYLSYCKQDFDFLFESGVYEILSEEILNKAKYGTIGIHESPLPEGKGYAPIQWAVLNKRKNLTVTLYKLDNKIDTGLIINQHNVPILDYDTLKSLNEKRKKGIQNCFRIFLDELSSGFMVLRKQTGRGSYHKKRTPASCKLDSSLSLEELWDYIRICDNEDYPAWFNVRDKKIIIRYEVIEDE